MAPKAKKTKKLSEEKVETIKIDTEDMAESHIRILRTLTSILSHVVTTDDEAEFFEGSAEALRLCASLVKQAKFTKGFRGMDGVPYSKQALEYSLEVLQEQIEKASVITYDN
ncbi:MAG: hypothetical protein HN509_10950 [Halobacteriovoraceae bacterium]|nr:hypothetical protein [Halobacteriovoraceae bacterium]MBT5096107.1 hypothetical protein [Halobacteriovoraceae bacterium]